MRALLVLALVSSPALAQSTVNPGALDRPKPSSPTTNTKPAQTQAASPLKTAKPPIPTEPPPIASLPPPVSVPTAKPPPPPPVPVTADAPGDATPLPTGIRVTFGPDRSDLNASTVQAIRAFAAQVKPNEQAAIDILAYAAGGPDDPSTPRRVSLARALAARAVLISEGIASVRIYPRALGTTAGDGPPDRVDLLQAGAKP